MWFFNLFYCCRVESGGGADLLWCQPLAGFLGGASAERLER